MKAAIFLLAFSAATGFALGTSFSGLVILLSNLALTTLSAIVMQIAGFDGLWGIAYIVVCLSVNQFAYVLGRPLLAAPRTKARSSMRVQK